MSILTYSLKELVGLAKERAPFYGELYRGIDPENFFLKDLPIIEQESFWQDQDKILTGCQRDGIVFKSGGTTGNPKFSVFTKKEWESFTQIFGEGLDHNILEERDRVGNLFYAGELYASFVFIMKSLEYAKKPLIHYPLAGKVEPSDLANMIEDLSINVLAGVPTSIIKLMQTIEGMTTRPPLEKILYGGESLYPDQYEYIKRVYPDIQIGSIGYASVDGGQLGYVDKTCSMGEHRCFADTTIMEIVDEEGNVIDETGVAGRLLLTNLSRALMPIIRYPVGDQAMWMETPGEGQGRGRKFRILGRTDVGARIGPVTVNRDDIVSIFSQLPLFSKVSNFQLVIDHFEGKDQLSLVLAAHKSEHDELQKTLIDLRSRFYSERPMFQSSIESQLIHPLGVEVKVPEELLVNPRTGKLRFVVDNRFA
jgi:phenylacetate-CoA ligase